MSTGTYSSSRYFSSSSVNSLPRTSIASSMRSTVERPMMGLDTRLLIHASATWAIFQSRFFAISSTRSMICLSLFWRPVLSWPAFSSPSERMVEPEVPGGRARWPLQRGAHCCMLVTVEAWETFQRTTYWDQTNTSIITKSVHLTLFFAI
jgi:hypothetical protein